MAEIIEDQLHWADEKEVIKSNKPLLLIFVLMKHLPNCIVYLLIFPIAFFYFVCSKRARLECDLYQKNLRLHTGGCSPRRISAFKQILSFTLCVMEKMEGWLGNIKYDKIICHDDDLNELKTNLENKKGALLLGSHLGNIELLRSLSSFGEHGVSRSIPVTTIIELKATEQFNRTLHEINPDVDFDVIDPSDINPDTIIKLQETIEKGGLVVVAGDRTSARSRDRFIRTKFLGKQADFPYGVFLIAALLKCPVYFCFGLRSKTVTLFPKYHMFVERSKISFNCSRKERESLIRELCDEFVRKLEKFCERFPFQWYNFYNFWLLRD